MIATSFFLAASSLFSLALGAPVPSLVSRGVTNYQVFGGDGTVVQGWPSSKQWLKFEDLWAMNQDTLRISCKQFGAADNTEAEIDAIYAALGTVATESGLDKRFLLAVMMQESKGCVRAPTTNYGYNNPGLFQSFQGKGTCNPDNVNMKTPCPKSDIELMVREGAGIGLEFGLLQAISQTGASDDSKYYKGARTYNSGSVHASGNLGAGIATHCYASDIANRLVGWADDKGSSCSESAIQSAQGSGAAYAGAVVTDEAPKPAQGNKPSTPPVVPTTKPATGKVDTPPTVTAPTGNKIAGAAANCKSWYTIKAGDSCANAPVSFDTLRKLNPSLDANCSNLWLGYSYCTAA